MNEQIKSKLHKLADQCKHPDNYHQGSWMDYLQFAELIVKECADICDKQSRSGWNDDRKAQARLDRDLIKESFGVD